MLQVFLLTTLLRGSGTGIMVALLFIVGMVIMTLTGSNVIAGLLGIGLTIFFALLIGMGVMHVVRFFLVAVLSAALVIKRITRRF